MNLETNNRDHCWGGDLDRWDKLSSLLIKVEEGSWRRIQIWEDWER